MKKNLLRYGLTVLAAAVLVGIYLWLNSYSVHMVPMEKYRIWANAFTVAGIVILAVGAMVWVSTTGFFDGIGYGLKHLFKALLPGYTKGDQTFSDYKTEMIEKHKKFSVLHLIIVGAACLALTAFFMVKFYSLYQR